ncbi:MAG: hypothetical protein ACR2O2_12445 [Ruegeria sp.]
MATLCAITFALPAAAQTLISPDQFLDMAVGKTLTFYHYQTGAFVGVEQFLNRSLTVWQEGEDTCVYGQISVPDGQICFLYDNDDSGVPVCWWPFLHDDRLMVRLAPFGQSEIQEVRSVTNETISCPNAPIS